MAPDLRGHGRSAVYERQQDYAQERIVADMIGLLDALGRERAIWVGHDWGSPVVWNIASHHPDRCDAVASLCVPCHTMEYGLKECLPLVDRSIHPADEFPAGQWEYLIFYQECFDAATAVLERNPYNTAKLLFRKGRSVRSGQTRRDRHDPQDGGLVRRRGCPVAGRSATGRSLDPGLTGRQEP